MRQLTLFLTAAILTALPCLAQPQLPAEPGASVPLADGDYELKLGETGELRFTAPADLGSRQVVLAFRVRIDAPTTVGSTNMLALAVNDTPVLLRNDSRALRLLNKPNTFAWTNPPELNWYVTSGQWRLAYAPDFEVLNTLEHYGPQAYEFAFDITDLVERGRNTVSFRHTGNEAIARNANSDLTIVFRDLRLEVREGPGLQRVEVAAEDRLGAWQPRERRSEPIRITRDRPGAMLLRIGGQRYELTSEFSAPGAAGETQWLTFPRQAGPVGAPRIAGPGWTLERTITERLADGRLLVSDAFTSTADEPVGIRVRHRLRLLDGTASRVSFGGVDDPTIVTAYGAGAPYIFLPRTDSGAALVADDDVLRNHAKFDFDDDNQVAALADDWFGLHPGASYTMRWGVYATDTGSDLDLINLLREDWQTQPFTIEGGINFFDPDSIIAYDDEELRAHLQMLNINVTMSQGGWYDRKLLLSGTPNIGHGPIVASDFYADYRVRLRQAIEKLHRLRPGIKCLIYYDSKLIAGDEYLERYDDALVRNADGSPRQVARSEQFGMPIALVCPTLENSLGRDILAQIPPMILDEIGADGLYWDEMSFGFAGLADYAHLDGNAFRIDQVTGEIIQEGGAPELAWLDFKLALLDAFTERGGLVVGNGTPGTHAELDYPQIRFTENMIPHHGSESILRTTLHTPICYAGYSVYHDPEVTEADFLADIRRKIEEANLYLFSAPQFYRHFTHENLASFQYPITLTELDYGVIIGEERIITLREGSFGWPGETWSGELILFDAEQRIISRERVNCNARGLIEIALPEGGAAVVVKE